MIIVLYLLNQSIQIFECLRRQKNINYQNHTTCDSPHNLYWLSVVEFYIFLAIIMVIGHHSKSLQQSRYMYYWQDVCSHSFSKLTCDTSLSVSLCLVSICLSIPTMPVRIFKPCKEMMIGLTAHKPTHVQMDLVNCTIPLHTVSQQYTVLT